MRAFSMRSFWLPVMLTTLIAAFFGALLAHRGGQWDQMTADKAALLAQLADLEQQNARLRAERQALLSSPEAIERVAREDYGFAAPGERSQAVTARPPARPVVPPPSGRAALLALVWDRISIALPLAVFVVTGFVFGLLSIFSGRGARPADGPA
jgi:cell division protein FtsB